jgi:phospholipase/carboxylesterase
MLATAAGHGMKPKQQERTMPDLLDAVHWGPASKGTPKQLVVLCHGLGADAYDLIDLAPAWADAVPDALFASVNAPDEHYSGFGRQWWAVGDRRPQVMLEGARRAANLLNAFVDTELDRLGLERDACALMGFSQGAMTVLFAGLRRPIAPRTILAFSGALIAPELLAGELQNKAPVLIVHGEADGQVPVHRSREAEAALLAAGVPVEALYVANLGHGIDDSGIAMGARALQRAFT